MKIEVAGLLALTTAVYSEAVFAATKTLSGLACTEGQIAQFLAGEWQCADLPSGGGGGGIPFQVVAANGTAVGVTTAIDYDRNGAVLVSALSNAVIQPAA